MDPIYREWCNKKIKTIIEYYGYKFFNKKKVLDLGCGTGEIAVALARLGANVICVDARQDYINNIRQNYPYLRAIQSDLDDPNWQFDNDYDLILSVSLICHIKNYKSHIENICNNAENIVIETEVFDSSNNNAKIPIFEEKRVSHLSFNGEGSVLSSQYIENIISNTGAQLKRFDDKKTNSGPFQYDWNEVNSNERKFGNRRLWFVRRDKFLFQQFKNNKALKTNNVENIINNNPAPTEILPEYIPPGNIAINNIKPPEPYKEILYSYSSLKDFKLAVCISGHLRSFEKTYGSFLENVIPKNKTFDTFVHTWETLGSYNSKSNSDSNLSNTQTTSKLREINQFINPTKIEIENYNVYNTILKEMDNRARLTEHDKGGLHNRNLIAYGSMLYSMNRVKNMLEEHEKSKNINYDMIIRLRPDLMFLRKINIEDYLLNKLYTPDMAQYYDNGINDQFAIGDNRSIKIYLSLFDNILEYINNRVVNPLRPEIFLKYHLLRNGINIIESPISYDIIRPNGVVITSNYKRGQIEKR